MAKQYRAVSGKINEITALAAGTGKGCLFYVDCVDGQGEPFQVLITAATYVYENKRLQVGMDCTFWFDANAPMVLIYPPRYVAAFAAENKEGRMMDVSYYGKKLVNTTNSLMLIPGKKTEVIAMNNQFYVGELGGNYLMVEYGVSTRSIPAQTTPKRIVVLRNRV
ncbi:MAG: hypothetical protein MJ114_02800 [Acetatifactor sp.]|nr:hypothetical protein [Acetatifactor sp.]